MKFGETWMAQQGRQHRNINNGLLKIAVFKWLWFVKHMREGEKYEVGIRSEQGGYKTNINSFPIIEEEERKREN